MKAAYFPHDYNARTDPKLQQIMMKHGLQGIGAYWCIVEMMYEQGGKLPTNSIQAIAYNLHTTQDMIQSIICDFDLFVVGEEHFSSKSVQTRIVKKEEISEMKRRAANARWNTDVLHKQCTRNADAMHVHTKTDADAMQSECRCNAIYKENKSKENKNINSSSKSCRFTPPTTEEVEVYIKEKGYTFTAEAFIDHYTSNGWMVGRNKMKDWKAAVRNWARGEQQYNNNTQYAKPINNPDKRRGYDVNDNADYTTTTF